jgi:salicylate hydroxylase
MILSYRASCAQISCSKLIIHIIIIINFAVGNITFHRADFLQVLVSELDPSITTSHFSKKLVSYVQTPPEVCAASRKHGAVSLQFSDGTSSSCDVLIGADGIHSITRKLLLEEAMDTGKLLQDMKDPVWSGSVAYRALISGERLRRLNPTHRALTTPQNVSDVTLLLSNQLMVLSLKVYGQT